MNWVISTPMKPTIKPTNIFFKAIQKRDLDFVLTIEKLCYENPWSSNKFLDTLANPNSYSQALIADDGLIGYAFFNLAGDSADLLNLAIHPNYQQQGFAQLLMKKTFSKLTKLEVNCLYLEVRESNHRAINFYQKVGFKQISIRKKYYSNGENAKIMNFDFKHP